MLLDLLRESRNYTGNESNNDGMFAGMSTVRMTLPSVYLSKHSAIRKAMQSLVSEMAA